MGHSPACGIVGYIGPQEASTLIMEGLRTLQNRGYDSAGITTIDTKAGCLVTTKFASQGSTSDALDRLASSLGQHGQNNHIGLGHTRWATHGAKTDRNAHPHEDQTHRFAIIHNGAIFNSSELRNRLIKLGYTFHSETDTEVIVQLISYHVHHSGLDTPSALKRATQELEGTWGLVLLDLQMPDRLFLATNGSPLLIGIGQGEMFVASEAHAFSQYTNSYIPLADGEIAVITSHTHSLDDSRIEESDPEHVETSPAPYPFWTLKEIMEQPEAILRSLTYGARFQSDTQVKLGGLDAARSRLVSIEHLLITGCGTSWHASEYGARLFRYLRAVATVRAIDSAECTHEDFPPAHGGLLALSQSGETKDVHRALLLAAELGVPVFSIVNKVRSMIARFTNCGVYVNAGREHAVASTKAFTCQVMALSLTAVWFAQQRDHESDRRRRLIEALHRASTCTGMVLRRQHPLCRQIAARIQHATSLFVLGRGFAEPIAREGALKIKEISYIHAEGYPGGALKHGPFALIDEGTPIFLVCPDDQHLPFMQNVAAQVHARHAYVVVITDAPEHPGWEGIYHTIIPIPSNGVLTALLAVIPLQLIAYELSILKKIDPDHPRALAKTVTVD